MKRLIALLNGILPFIVALLIQYSIMVLVDMLLKVTFDLNIPYSIASYYIALIAVIVCGLVFFFWYTNTIHYRKLVIPKQVFTFRNIGLLVCLGIAVQFTISGFMSLIAPLLQELFREYGQVVDSILNHDIIAVALYVAIFAPITEELIFRGVMLTKLQEALPFYAANLLQAASFGIYHWNIVQGLYAFGVGLLLGYIARRFRSLTAAILLHMAANVSSFLVLLVPRAVPAYAIVTAAGGISIFVMLYILNRKTDDTGHKKYE